MSNPHYVRAEKLSSESKLYAKLSFLAAIISIVSSVGILADAELNKGELIHILKEYVQPEALIAVPFATMIATKIISYWRGENAAESRRMGHMG